MRLSAPQRCVRLLIPLLIPGLLWRTSGHRTAPAPECSSKHLINIFIKAFSAHTRAVCTTVRNAHESNEPHMYETRPIDPFIIEDDSNTSNL